MIKILVTGVLGVFWTASAFAVDTATIYLHDQNERTIIPSSVFASNLYRSSGQGFELYISDSSGDYTITFGVRKGDPLALRAYADAQPSGTQSVLKPTLEVTGSALTCKVIHGGFQILEFSVVAGELTKVALDFLENCADGTVMEGAVRFNSDLPISKNPVVLAPAPVDPISTAPNLLTLDSPAGDPIGKGKQSQFTNADGFFSMLSTTSTIEVTFENKFYYTLTFAPISGQALALGHYDNVMLYPYNDRFGVAGLEVASDTSSCNKIRGSFEILELQVNPVDKTKVDKFAANFEQGCDSGPVLKGKLRFNSLVP